MDVSVTVNDNTVECETEAYHLGHRVSKGFKLFADE